MVLAALRHVVHHHPFKFGCVFSCAKTAFSDWLVQSQIEKREHIDWRRNSTFALFGLGYLGGVQYAIYVPLFSRMFPNAASYAAAPIAAKMKDVAGTRNMLTQVFLDQFVHHPLMYFPAFYSLKEVINGGKVEDGLAKYSVNYREDLAALWKLWVPSTIINFTFMPMQLRIPWVASTSLIWTCIISYMRGSSDVETDPEAAMNITGPAQGRPLQALYDLGTAAKPDFLYDRSKTHLLFTATGRDRIGFIQECASLATRNASNVLDVKAYKVGREFVTIMLVETEKGSADILVKGMKSLGTKGLQVSVQTTQPWLSDDDSPRCKDGVLFTGHLRATGPDRPKLLEALTQLLSELELDITSFSCNQHLNQSLGSGELQQLFQMSGVVRAFVPVDRTKLDQRLVAFETEHGCRLGITETEVDMSYSAFRSPSIASSATASKASRLVKSLTEKNTEDKK